MATIDASYDMALELTFFVVRGSVTAEDIVDAIETNYVAHPTSNSIWDLTGCDLSNFDMNGMIKVTDSAKEISAKRKNPRTIIVVAQEQEAYLMKLYGEIAEMRGSPIHYVLASSVKEAFGILGGGTSAA